VHFSETCDEDTPQLITHVQTTRAGINDEQVLSAIHAGLAEKKLLPDQHLVDAGYVDAANLLQSHDQYEVDLLGPVRHNYWWQADTEYDVTHFSIDWQAKTVTCPRGKISSSWTPAQDAKGHPVIKIKFSQSDCKACPAQASCTGHTRRTLTLQPPEKMQALLAARKRESTEEFKKSYRHRAGIEGTHSEANTYDGIATFALLRPSQDPFGAYCHCHGDQSRSPDELAARRSTRSNADFSLQAGNAASYLGWGLTSPPVSTLVNQRSLA
jgi:transposase